MELLKSLYRISSPSKCEKKMKKFIKSYIKKNIPGAVWKTDHIGNLLITKGKSDTYPCVAAHMDEVCPDKGKKFEIIEQYGVMFGYNFAAREQTGLGGDDKNGIWICLNALKRFDVIKCAFFIGEEAGCIGSSDVNLEFFNDCRFILEPDRRGGSDLIATSSGVHICSDDFEKAIEPYTQSHGYKNAFGSVTDVLELVERGVGISTINLSCGYYNAHSNQDYTVVSELINAQEYVFDIIENVTDVYPHEYDERKRHSSWDGWYGNSYSWIYGTQKVSNDTPRCTSAFESKMTLPEEEEKDTDYNSWWEQYDEMMSDLTEFAGYNGYINLEDYYLQCEGVWPLLGYDDFKNAYNEVYGTPYEETELEEIIH